MDILRTCYFLYIIGVMGYFFHSAWKFYQNKHSFHGVKRPAIYYVALFSLVASQFILPSFVQKVVLFLVVSVLTYLFYSILGIHNQKNNSGEQFSAYQKEIRRDQRIVAVVAVVFLLLLIITLLT